LKPVVSHASGREYLATALGFLAFLPLFVGIFWLKKRAAWLCLAGVVLLGMIFAPYNGGAATFFIYGAAFSPFLAKSEWRGAQAIAVIVSLAALETWLLHLDLVFLLYAGGFALVIGAGNIFFAQRSRANEKLRLAQEEIEHLAKTAERERIARDLHDVLGHTLSVVILKSQLAGKLLHRDPARAQTEIQEVEQISRQALAEVRHTIRGYRANSLEQELQQALSALETAGVEVQTETRKLDLTPTQEGVVALIVREAVTNVVRHAQARHCRVRLLPENGQCLLEIADDGQGGAAPEGSGLRGMRERVAAVGGTLVRDTHIGTRLTIQFPITSPDAGDLQ
jgi:two-component system sensor histidine kinase DesK